MNDWKCANDNPDSVNINPPSENVRISHASKSFAKGDCEVILAKGGPMGVFFWAHLHGIHNDRFGETRYIMSAIVKGKEDGFIYGVLYPALNTVVKGVSDKPERHRHCFIQTVLPPGQEAEWLKLAVENGTALEIEIIAERDRDDIDWVITSLKDLINDNNQLINILNNFISGELGVVELLNKLNNGKLPHFLT